MSGLGESEFMDTQGGVSLCGTATANVKSEDTFRILLATDIHLGYCDTDPQRENDSFITFEEILKYGRDEEVDFILLAGDLFHENKPKPATLHKTIQLLRKYCLGGKPIEFEYWGNPSKDFPNGEEDGEINYLNPNVNIALPVLTIHGNHDDPVGMKKTSAVDHLVAAKLVNHFGQWEDLNNILVQAVPLVKGDTKLALYGLGNIKDERLFRLFRDGNVKFARPKESSEEEEWFNVFVIHQNRVQHGQRNYFPESFIPYFFDVCVWGHEHECRIDPEPTETKTFIIQPGSSVATSLCYGESRDKHVGILEICKRRFRLIKKQLETVRPMLLDDIDLKEVLPSLKIPKGKDPSEYVEKYVTARVELLIRNAADKLTGNPLQPTEPLVRVRVFYEHPNQTFNPIRFAQKFFGRVINDDIVMFKKISNSRSSDNLMDFQDMDGLFDKQDYEHDLDSHVETIVEEFFKKARTENDHANILEVLSERGLSEAVKTAVEKDDRDALTIIIDKQIDKVCNYLMNKKEDLTEDNVEEYLEEFRRKKYNKPEEDRQEAIDALRDRPDRRSRTQGNDDEDWMNGNGRDRDGDEDEVRSTISEDGEDTDGSGRSNSNTRGRGRGSRGGKGASSSRSRGRGRGGGAAVTLRKMDPPSPKPKKTRGSRGGGSASTSNGKKDNGPNLVQTKLNIATVRTSPRKKRTMVFDVSDDSD